MEEKYKSVNCETNHCAITGAASFFCAIKDAVILVNGSRFCFKQMLHNLEKTFRQPVRSRLFCTELQEESIIFGTEALLERELKKRGVTNRYACIASPVKEDEYLTNASENFHRRMGYALAGTFHRCGFKFGRFYDMIWMEKLIGAAAEPGNG